MRILVQRVTEASVTVDGAVVGAIGHGLLLLVGIGAGDDAALAQRMAEKIVDLRLFEDDQGRMQRSLRDLVTGGADAGVLVISQFTLYGDVRKGRRPSFSDAAHPDLAAPLVEAVAAWFCNAGIPVATGRFGAHMHVASVNDGPVTLWLDSEELQRPRRGGGP